MAFLGGETNQWAPLIYDGVTLMETPDDPNYHFTTDMTNQAISWIRLSAGACTRQTILHLLCSGCNPCAASCTEGIGIDKYKGKFDQGWDKLREETLARQKKTGDHSGKHTIGP